MHNTNLVVLVLLTFTILAKTELFEKETMKEYFMKQDVLISHVLSQYRKDVPPIYTRVRWSSTEADPMFVNITLMYAKLLSINEPEQTIDLIFEHKLASFFWSDVRLTWNPADFDGIEGFFVNRELVWRPDLLPYDSRSISDTRDPDVQHVYIAYNGQMEFYVSSVISIACPIDIKKFPFDKQTCEVNLASYNFLTSELRLMASIYKNYNITYASNGEWTVERISVRAYTLTTKTHDYDYDVATFTFQLRRSSIFYVVLIIIPSFILTFLCVLGLFWSKFDHTDYLEKLGLGFAAILAMCMVLEIAEESVPKTRQLPALCSYIYYGKSLIGNCGDIDCRNGIEVLRSGTIQQSIPLLEKLDIDG
ncbi:Neurotransmitter-gated ion-channel ligand binding domain protein [Ancylostoma duodenale]|uniref:Neurotransmitter-gated ion-channel ligand binding domain protein n=1 Tax=Ancylostoma duodenale TaxID=51022 RepID=A0A0C2D8L7_9BILA|nr:Neurotransmitter-gated ion-channel ligand binding domain protein [Ancylostoma duodenale]